MNAREGRPFSMFAGASGLLTSRNNSGGMLSLGMGLTPRAAEACRFGGHMSVDLGRFARTPALACRLTGGPEWRF